MSSDEKIGAPFTLASLPHPINATGGRTYAAGVCSINGTKKRKRTEIAVGVDGEGILVYSVQNPQLVTSYALPPQTSFAAAPCSIYRKGASKRSFSRHTYAAVSHSTSGAKCELVSFHESVQKDGATDTVKSSYSLPQAAGGIVSVDVIPTASGSQDVLVIFEDGQTHCLSSDLKTLRWTTNVAAPGPGQSAPKTASFVEYAILSTAKVVMNGLLRNRQDVAAILDPSMGGTSDLLDITPVLCIVSRSDGHSILQLLQLQATASDIISTRTIPAKPLVSWALPTSPDAAATSNNTSPSTYHLHASTGVLHQLSEGNIISYDFAGTVPRITSTFSPSSAIPQSFLRISQDMLFTASEQTWGIIDVKYGTVQSLRAFEATIVQDETHKRKIVDQGSRGQSPTRPDLVVYFAESSLIVAVVGNELIGLPVSESVTRKRVKSNSTLLIDAVGKGVPEASTSKQASALIKGSVQWQEWAKRMHKLDKYVSKGKIARFEEAFAADLGVLLENKKAQTTNPENGDETITGSTEVPSVSNNGAESVNDGQLRRWLLLRSIPDTQRYRHQHRATYALGKIFRLSKSKNKGSHLKVDFFPPNVFQWLLLAGYVNKESIRRALLEQSPTSLEAAQAIADGDIVKSLVDLDPDMHILSAVLNHSQFLPVGEVVQAIRLLLRTMDDQPQSNAEHKLLTNGTEPSEDEMDVEFASELDAAADDLDHALSMLDHGLDIRSDTFTPALIRLHTFSNPIITSTLRSMLPRRDLESLIRLLHSELKNGGWSTPYRFEDAVFTADETEVASSETTPEEPNNQAMAIIASLLSCALDAIGAGAWLSPSLAISPSSSSTESIIKDLHSDACAAETGFWEASYMRGLLSEFLRYASQTRKSHVTQNEVLRKMGKPFLDQPELADGELPMMPLGGKADMGVEKITGVGDKMRVRSAREIGMLISRRVPKYSLERIVI